MTHTHHRRGSRESLMGDFVVLSMVDPEVKAQLVELIQKNIDIYKVAGWGFVDDVIDPRDTRRVVAWGLELAEHKRVERPAKKRGILPV